MSAALLAGLLMGIAWALIDVWLLRRAIKKACSVPEQAQHLMAVTLTARYLLTFAVLAVALLIPGVDALGVVISLIVQKVAVAVMALRQK
ncbi:MULTISPECIES: ATP synthase subunit I [Anaerotruncus]|jgi:hypothetical protein|uniref:ATP synthase subunit I n=2 Tax=Anaerotruncus colihominis TaxID=169435 RepID=A0A845RJG8_9FIRM|nr:ATP synthase subunit I [Anaerotruncus sp.]MCR2024016.1 hypothetical protein [Anaerotruncus colihominis]NBI79699.1 hypothetical protein [Anaerotruncus colihominis]